MAKRKIVITVSGSKGVDLTEIAAFIVGQLRGQNIIAAYDSKDEARLQRIASDDYSLALAMGKIAQSQQLPLEDQDEVMVVEGDIIEDLEVKKTS